VTVGIVVLARGCSRVADVDGILVGGKSSR
jgi:hypothetical protein